MNESIQDDSSHSAMIGVIIIVLILVVAAVWTSIRKIDDEGEIYDTETAGQQDDFKSVDTQTESLP